MNQFYRAIHMNPTRLIKKIIGFEEIYTIAYRPYVYENGIIDNTNTEFVRVPYDKKYWYADPVLFEHNKKSFLFMEAYEQNRLIGKIAVSEIKGNGEITSPEIILTEEYHLSFPMVFEWNSKIYMIPESSENRSVNLYVAKQFPFKWDLIKSFHVHDMLVDAVPVLENEDEIVILLSAINSENPLLVKKQKYIIKQDESWHIEPVTNYNQNQEFNFLDRNAGKLFKYKSNIILPKQESTKIDYGVFLNFYIYNDSEEKMIKNIGPDKIRIKSIKTKNIVGIHSYSVDSRIEVIDARYLKFTPFYYFKRILKRGRK